MKAEAQESAIEEDSEGARDEDIETDSADGEERTVRDGSKAEAEAASELLHA